MIKSFGKRVLFSVPQTIVIYSMFKLLKGFEKQTIRNFQEPISFFAPRKSYIRARSGFDRNGRYEAPLLERFFKSLNSKSVVLDIGADVGIYTLIAGKKTKNIHCFEPDPYAVYLMKKNIERLNINPTIVRKFVGDKNASNMITIDTYCQQNNVYPTHIKIDIEGYEIFALRGMDKTLTWYGPKLFIEFHERIIKERLKLSQKDVDNFFKFLKKHGYNMIFNGHHYEMLMSQNKLYNFEWYSNRPNSINYACIAERS